MERIFHCAILLFGLILCIGLSCETRREPSFQNVDLFRSPSAHDTGEGDSSAAAMVATDSLAPSTDTATSVAEMDSAPPANTGRLCFAPIDNVGNRGIHGAVSDPFGGTGNGAATARNVVMVRVGEHEQMISGTTGAMFMGLSLDETHLISMRDKGNTRPYFQHRIRFATGGPDAFCVYDNGLYGTTQISETARRRFCRKCFQAEVDIPNLSTGRNRHPYSGYLQFDVSVQKLDAIGWVSKAF